LGDALPDLLGRGQDIGQNGYGPGHQDKEDDYQQSGAGQVKTDIGRQRNTILLPTGTVVQVGQAGQEQDAKKKVATQVPGAGGHGGVVSVNDEQREAGGKNDLPGAGVASEIITSMHAQHPEEGGHQE